MRGVAVASFALAVACGCGGSSSQGASVDAGREAGTDAGSPAAKRDAGSPPRDAARPPRDGGSHADATDAFTPLRATAWPEADRLFRGDPHWVGADDAYSVDLGGGKVLWLFGDTFISPSGSGKRTDSTLVHNTLAIQTGYDPATATLKFYWATDSGGTPIPFFSPGGGDWFWPGGGVLLDKPAGGHALLLFMIQAASAEGGLGFASAGWAAVYVDDPTSDPTAWTVKNLGSHTSPQGIVVGSATSLTVGGRLVSLSPDDTLHDVYLASFPLAQAAAGDLSGIEYWSGSSWTKSGRSAQAVMLGGQTELSVSLDPGSGRYVEIQTLGFGATTIGLRAAPAVTGPWPSATVIYTPPESTSGPSGVLVYAAKGHPELTGADLVVTYASNDTDFGTLVSDLSLYFPRFVKVTFGSAGP
jgi:hypothetical protein